MIDDEVIGQTIADVYRPDLQDAGKGDGCYGFSITLLEPGKAGQLPALRVRNHGAQAAGNEEWLHFPSPKEARPAEPERLAHEGYLDVLRPEGAHGWVWYPTEPHQRLKVEAVVDDHVIATGVADSYREDLRAAGKGDGAHAFYLTFDPPLPEEAEVPTIRIKGSPSQTIPGSAQWSRTTIVPKRPVLKPKLELYIDKLDTEGAAGWAWNAAEPGATVRVDAVQRGRIIFSVLAETNRPDLIKAGKGTGRYGFSMKFTGLDLGGNPPELRVDQSTDIPFANIATVPEAPIEGHIDYLDRAKAQGWVWRSSHPDAPLTVEARLGGRVVGRAVAEDMREDLLKWGKGTGRYGFSLSFYDMLLGTETPEFVVVSGGEETLGTEAALPALAEDELPDDGGLVLEKILSEHLQFTQPGPDFEERDPAILSGMSGHDVPAKPLVFAFYLPQFHSIPENDRNWGAGFTEWRQMARALPRFPGHFQPRIPRDLGFYNLGDPTVLPRQAEMAKGAGIGAFCYYYYWFNGRRVLEKPLDAHMASSVDMPFMIMWANENWTKTWDGFESDVLLSQDYRDEDEDALLADLARHFADPRYIRIDGRPLFFIYNPRHLSDSHAKLDTWRRKLRDNHGMDPLLFMGQTFEARDPGEFGFDGAIEFPPHKLASYYPNRPTPRPYSKSFKGRVIAYEDFVTASLEEDDPDFPLIKTAVPSWDNDSRRPGRGLSLSGVTPGKYQSWLQQLVERAMDSTVHGTPIVAINAWNEWAEAAYLEPDVHYGSAFLNATARAVVGAVQEYASPTRHDDLPKVSVILPCYNHARYLPERIGSVINQTVPPAEIIFLDDASTDDSVAVARKLLEGCGIPFRIEVNKKNSGNVFRQWLKGIALAEQDLIWVAETDDSADRDFLVHLLPAFQTGGVQGAFGHIRCIDPDGKLRNDLGGYYDGLKYHSWEKSNIVAAGKSFSYDFAIRNIVPNASGFVFRKPVLTKEEADRLLQYTFAGDWYFYALLLRGGSLAYRRKAKSYFRVSMQGASRSVFSTPRHLEEHRMVIEDLSREFGISTAALDEHARRLARHFSKKTVAEVTKAITPPAVERKLRICIAAHSFNVGGGEMVPLQLANKLKDFGHHVTFLVMERTPPGQSSIRGRLRSDIPVFYWDEIRSDVKGFVEDLGIDVFNSHNVGVEYHLNKMKVELPCAYVASLHGGYETVSDLLVPDFVRYLENHVDIWLYLAKKNRKVLLDAGLKGATFRKSFNAVDDTNVTWVDREEFLAQHGAPADMFGLVICSRAIENKGWRTSIEVARKLNKRQKRPVHIFLIGDGPSLEGWRKDYAGDDFVHFLGHVDTPMRYFRCFDMAVFPSTYPGESLPMFLLECLAAGLPFISSDIGDIPNLMGREEVRPGALVSWALAPDDMSEEIVIGVLNYMAEPAALSRVRANALKASRRFTLKKQALHYVEIFQEKIAARHTAMTAGERIDD